MNYKINAIVTSCKDIEKLVLEHFNVGEVFYLYQLAYKKAYGKFPKVKLLE